MFQHANEVKNVTILIIVINFKNKECRKQSSLSKDISESEIV